MSLREFVDWILGRRQPEPEPQRAEGVQSAEEVAAAENELRQEAIEKHEERIRRGDGGEDLIDV